MLKGLRNLFSLIRIALVFARNDALAPLEKIGPLPTVARLGRVVRRRKLPSRPGERLAQALTELGPTFIKLGQVLSTRSDLVGEEVSRDLARLQDRLPPFPADQARATVEAEFGVPVEELFARFEDEPVAAASIAQVHFAETTDGDEVAVKILRPGIEEAFARDLDLFYWAAAQIERWQPAMRRLKPVEVVETLKGIVSIEMDLRMEAAAASELADNFADDAEFVVPAIDWMRTSARVMTSQRVRGVRADDREALAAKGHDPEALMANAARVFFLQVFRDGFFHGDMHPGNLFITDEGAIAVVDFGIMGRLDRQTRLYLADMLVGFLTRDYERVAEVHFQAGFVPGHKSRTLFAQACRSIGEPILGKPQNEISVGRLLAQLFQVTKTFEMETQPQLLLLQKTMVQAEGMARLLNPDANMWMLAEPLIADWMRANLGPEARMRAFTTEMNATLKRLPSLLAEAERVLGELDAERRARSQGGAGPRPSFSLAGAPRARAGRLTAALAGAGAALLVLLAGGWL